MRRSGAGLAAGAVALAGVSSAWGQATFQGLGFPAGMPDSMSEATAVSPSGVYVAGRGAGMFQLEMFIWTEAGGMGPPITAACSCHARAYAMADDGLSAAGYLKPGGGIGPMRWDPAGGFVYIPGPPTVSDGIAYDMSADGSVVVGEHNNPAQVHAFRFVNGVVDHFMGSSPLVNSHAVATTPDGAVIVGTATAGVFRWREATGPVYIPAQPGVGTTIPEAVNRDASVIVGSRWNGGDRMAGRWIGDSWHDLAGPAPSQAMRVSGDGLRILGVSGPFPGVPTIWDDWKSGVPLEQALAEAGADIPAGWVLTDAADMSLDGTVIVGKGTDPSGRTQAWRAVLPRVCYANCDVSDVPPVLNVADFSCFLQRFAGGESYANCDQSTAAPALNVADFTCFLQRFAAGCP